jgi:hypothetical protein
MPDETTETTTTETEPQPQETQEQQDDGTAAMSPAQRYRLQQARQDRNYMMALSAEAWGSGISFGLRKAAAEYCRRNHLDPGEIDILGGKIYRNGYYYRRRIAELRTDGRVEWSKWYYIHHDERLDQLAKDAAEVGDTETEQYAKNEALFRMKERIRLSVPVDASHACVAVVKITGDANPLEGADWIQPGRTKKKSARYGGGEVLADPIGEEEPEKTVVTRAWRRAGLLVAAELPDLRQQEEILDADAEIIEEAIVAEKKATDANVEAAEAAARAQRAVPTVAAALPPGEPYGTPDFADAARRREAARKNEPIAPVTTVVPPKREREPVPAKARPAAAPQQRSLEIPDIPPHTDADAPGGGK